ncbi:unnamed protein product [Rhizoctonia solani]|uniref:DUF6533 domain-containing protein n=1 Tax=Rhizoctonia solani TaxID=456999 RepID=A0A8H2WRU7_9AGAM|nr:unnamed protein product [Rhizoctonia solani]CAE6529782.1 unnamed protein product [Rhizoctonia solani]
MATDLPAPVAHALLIQVATWLKATNYLAVVSLCVLVYDCAITIDQEVKFVWGQRWSFGKAVYIFIRYATILTMAGHVACMYAHVLIPPVASGTCRCHAVEAIFVWSEVAIIIAGSSVLIVRTWLLWGGTRWVLAVLIGGLLLASALSIYYVYIDMANFSTISVNPQLLRGCVVRIPSTVWRPILFPLLYETFVIILTVAKVSMTPNRAPLVTRLFVDGTLYFIAVAAVLLFTTIGAAYSPTRALVVGSGFHTVCINIGCSRLFLSLHSWADESQHRSATHFSQSRSSKQPHHSPNSPLSTSLPQGFLPVRSDEVTLRADIETGTNPDIRATVSIPQSAVPNVRSMLPDIKRPSLPEQMLFKSSLVHTPQRQRQHRPPRSSSLYPARSTIQGSESTGQLVSTPELKEAIRGTNKTLAEETETNDR